MISKPVLSRISFALRKKKNKETEQSFSNGEGLFLFTSGNLPPYVVDDSVVVVVVAPGILFVTRSVTSTNVCCTDRTSQQAVASFLLQSLQKVLWELLNQGKTLLEHDNKKLI